jgi:hypothetical protein
MFALANCRIGTSLSQEWNYLLRTTPEPETPTFAWEYNADGLSLPIQF